MDLPTVSLFLLVGIIEIISVWLVNRRLSYEHDFMVERGTFGDQLEEWLTREVDLPDGSKMDNLTAFSARLGQGFAASMRGADMQTKSVESRVMNNYSKKIQDAVKQKIPLGYKILFKVANQLGFDLEEIMEKGELTEFYNAAKANRLDLLLQGNNGASSPQSNHVPTM